MGEHALDLFWNGLIDRPRYADADPLSLARPIDLHIVHSVPAAKQCQLRELLPLAALQHAHYLLPGIHPLPHRHHDIDQQRQCQNAEKAGKIQLIGSSLLSFLSLILL